MEKLAVIISSIVPFAGIFIRRRNSPNNADPQCFGGEAANGAVWERWLFGRFNMLDSPQARAAVLQVMIMVVHASNAIIVYSIIQKFLQSHGRRRYSQHVRICCSIVPTALLLGMHSLRSALFNEENLVSFFFLSSVLIGLLGVLRTISTGTDQQFKPTTTAKALMICGCILVVVVLASATGSTTSIFPTESQLPGPTPPTTAATSQRHKSATLQYSFPWTSFSILFGRINTATASTWSKQALVRILKVLQAALNVVKAQLFLPVNVDRGYVQQQLSAIESVLGIRCPSDSRFCGITTFALIPFLRRMFAESAVPVWELGAVVALVGYITVKYVREQRMDRTSGRHAKWRLQPLGVSAAALVTLLSCAGVAVSPSEGARGVSETVLLSLHSYIPSVFFSLCLGVYLADAWGDDGTPANASSSSSSSLIEALSSMARSRGGGGAAGGLSDKVQARNYWALRARQLLLVAAVTVAADTTFKSFHPEPRCFFRSGLMSLEFICCPV
jgi:hypothetical protein